jgi:uncharacterized membrane protein YccC
MEDPVSDARPAQAPQPEGAAFAWRRGLSVASGEFVRIAREAFSALGRELMAFKPSPARAVFATQAMISVALAVALAYAFHLSNTWWAAISGFAVMQTSFAASLTRGAHRILGTVAGALLGAIAGPALGGFPWLLIPALGVIGGVTVYKAIGSARSYAWVLGGVTALMVAYEAHKLASVPQTASFAMLRVAEVVVGTFACVLVSGAFDVGMRRYRAWRESSPAGGAAVAAVTAATPAAESAAVHSARTLLAWEGGIAIAVLAALIYVLNLPGFAQAMVTSVVVLNLPVASLAGSTPRPVAQRMVQRFMGCLLAGLVSVVLLPVLGEHAIACMIVLSLGVWTGCHVQTGSEGASYVGIQFTVAFIMVFVQDHHWSSDPKPALMRLAGILIGIVVLSCVMLAANALTLMRRPAGTT